MSIPCRGLRALRTGSGWAMQCLGLSLIATLPTPASWAQTVAETVGEGIVRFHRDPAALEAAPPSLSLVAALPETGPAPVGLPVVVHFQTVHGRAAARIDVEDGTSLYGTGEVAGPLLRNGSRTTAWNFDAYGYGASTPHLYKSHPWVLAVRADGSAFGVLADTPERCHIDLSRGILLIADGPAFGVLVIDRESPQDVVQALGALTGTMPIPPRWALGYHQCRYSYHPASRVREIARGFRQRDIPCDVIWLDIDYMEAFRSFTWDEAAFPDPRGLTDDLREQGFRSIAILDPGIARLPGYGVYERGEETDAWVLDATGEPYLGHVWPGECVFPDFTRTDVRAWWAQEVEDFLEAGLDGLWNDMNEPAVFRVESKTMPLDAWHRADPELGGPGSHARFHNVYGMLMSRASYEGMLAARPERRPFVLTRATHLGGQRWAATWTGDNTASWAHLDLSVPMALNLGLSGMPLAGPDIGGFRFAGTPELFARWIGIGALLPFARGHTEKGQIDKEPWAFGPQVERTARVALQRRYRLLPLLYSLAREAHLTGMPICRPAFFVDPADVTLRAVDDHFLLGDGLLVVARTAPDAPARLPLTLRAWPEIDLGLGGRSDPNLPRFRLRPGHILPLGPVMEYSDERPVDPLELVVALDGDGRAEGWLYEDAGDGWDHRHGAYRVTRYRATAAGTEIVVRREVVEGDWGLAGRAWRARQAGGSGIVEGRGAELRLPLTPTTGE